MDAGLDMSEAADLPPSDPSDPRIEVFSGKAEADLNSGAVFSDQIRIRRGDGVLTAPGGSYDKATGDFNLEGGLDYRDPRGAISGKDAEFDSTTNEIQVDDASFEIFAVPARGSADSLTVTRDNKFRMTDVTYTTCAKGHEDWVLRAAKIDIDRDTGVATARDARLEFMGVPILYSPWISYPVTNERKSGFLLPAFGNSTSRGAELEIPYYFNLAPNYDATVTPRYMTQRGLELMSEFRYLGEGQTGKLEAEYLPNDKITNQDRYLVGWDTQSILGRGWRATFDGHAVSDSNYFEDLYRGVAATSQTNLERVLDFQYFDDTWSILARFQDYQTLDDSLTATEKPYKRVPQLAASAYVPDGVLGLDYTFDGEFSVFERNVGPTGMRLHLSPGVALPLRYRGFWLEPAAAIEHTTYSIENAEPGQADGPSRTTPIYTVDLGTIFERGSRGSAGWLQTLEPRVQYVHIPFRQQDDLPVYDTIEPDFNLVQLFRANRFLGLRPAGRYRPAQHRPHQPGRRCGQRHAVHHGHRGPVALLRLPGRHAARRLAGGQQVLRLARGIRDELLGPLENESRLAVGRRGGQSQRSEVSLRYRRDDQRVANVAYRYRRDSLEEVDVSAAWPLSDRWSVVGRFDYSCWTTSRWKPSSASTTRTAAGASGWLPALPGEPHGPVGHLGHAAAGPEGLWTNAGNAGGPPARPWYSGLRSLRSVLTPTMIQSISCRSASPD